MKVLGLCSGSVFRNESWMGFAWESAWASVWESCSVELWIKPVLVVDNTSFYYRV